MIFSDLFKYLNSNILEFHMSRIIIIDNFVKIISLFENI